MGHRFADEGDSVAGHCYPPFGKRFIKSVWGSFLRSSFIASKTSNKQYSGHGQSVTSSLELLQRPKREYKANSDQHGIAANGLNATTPGRSRI